MADFTEICRKMIFKQSEKKPLYFNGKFERCFLEKIASWNPRFRKNYNSFGKEILIILINSPG